MISNPFLYEAHSPKPAGFLKLKLVDKTQKRHNKFPVLILETSSQKGAGRFQQHTQTDTIVKSTEVG
mgnify:CR=1 FL=1